MTGVTVTVCASCPAAQDGLAKALKSAFDQAGIQVVLRGVDCMSGCTRPSTVAFRAPGKTAYLFGDLGLDDIPGLLAFVRLYEASPDGTFADARPLGVLREKAIARIPG